MRLTLRQAAQRLQAGDLGLLQPGREVMSSAFGLDTIVIDGGIAVPDLADRVAARFGLGPVPATV